MRKEVGTPPVQKGGARGVVSDVCIDEEDYIGLVVCCVSGGVDGCMEERWWDIGRRNDLEVWWTVRLELRKRRLASWCWVLGFWHLLPRRGR